jgi:hypothetical protein
MDRQKEEEQIVAIKLAIITAVGVLFICGALYAAYRYSQSQPNDIVLPGGVTYLGPSPTPKAN